MQQFVSSDRSSLPVIILADISGSKEVDGKIDALNAALRLRLRYILFPRKSSEC